MQHVLLLRHGQTDANAAGIIQGHMPTNLNALGRTQAERLATRLSTFAPRITRLVTSPLKRAMQTAEPIARSLDLPAEAMDGWTERYFGSSEGKPADLVRIMTHGDTGASATRSMDPEDAEPRVAFDERVRVAFAALDPVHVTAVVSHGGTIGSVIRQMMDGRIPTENAPTLRSPIQNCAILHLSRSVEGTQWTISCLNDVAHLAGLETDRDVG